jgi:predicted deacetylase
MSEIEDEIDGLLREAQAAEEVVREFARYWLHWYRQATQDILEQHRQEGRMLALHGQDPAPARTRAEVSLADARGELRDRLARLLAWARESGRLRG